MRWKLAFVGILLVGLAVVGAMGWYHFQALTKSRRMASDLELCKNQIAMGNHERAQVNLERILAENPRMAEGDALWALLADSYNATGAADKAMKCWEKIRSDYPDSPHYPNALSAVADTLRKEGKAKEAEKIWDQILTSYKGSPAAADALLGKATLLYEAEDLSAAREALYKILEQFPESPRRGNVEELLGKVNLDILYSPAMNEEEGDQIHSIAKGEKIETIGRRYKISPELIARANHIRDVRSLSVGRRLKIPSTEFAIQVDKTDNTLVLYNKGKFFKRYRVRTGKEKWLTPVGDFRILTKVKNPTWSNPQNGKFYPANDPANELGTRWLAFEGSAGLGIHGTIHPETVGQYASNGCVGMMMPDVEELFDLVPTGTPIKIVGKMTITAKTGKESAKASDKASEKPAAAARGGAATETKPVAAAASEAANETPDGAAGETGTPTRAAVSAAP